jgi:hypothetical protein
MGNSDFEAESLYRMEIHKKKKQLYEERDFTEDTIYIIAIGILRGETLYYVGMQLDREESEIRKAVKACRKITVHKMRLVSNGCITEQEASTMVDNFLDPVNNSKRMYINRDRRVSNSDEA